MPYKLPNNNAFEIRGFINLVKQVFENIKMLIIFTGEKVNLILENQLFQVIFGGGFNFILFGFYFLAVGEAALLGLETIYTYFSSVDPICLNEVIVGNNIQDLDETIKETEKIQNYQGGKKRELTVGYLLIGAAGSTLMFLGIYMLLGGY